MSAEITSQDFPEIRWQGHWIWLPEEPISITGSISASASINSQAPETHGLFRKSVYLEQVPDRVPARITADSRYALFVNGQEVSRGPIRSQPRRLYYDLFDLAPYLQAGENILAVYVKYYGIPKSYWMPASPNLTLGTAGILVFEANLGAANLETGGWLVSDASWKAKKSDAWSSDRRNDSDDPVGGGVPLEVFDARHFPITGVMLDSTIAVGVLLRSCLLCTLVVSLKRNLRRTLTALYIHARLPSWAGRFGHQPL